VTWQGVRRASARRVPSCDIPRRWRYVEAMSLSVGRATRAGSTSCQQRGGCRTSGCGCQRKVHRKIIEFQSDWRTVCFAEANDKMQHQRAALSSSKHHQRQGRRRPTGTARVRAVRRRMREPHANTGGDGRGQKVRVRVECARGRMVANDTGDCSTARRVDSRDIEECAVVGGQTRRRGLGSSVYIVDRISVLHQRSPVGGAWGRRAAQPSRRDEARSSREPRQLGSGQGFGRRPIGIVTGAGRGGIGFSEHALALRGRRVPAWGVNDIGVGLECSAASGVARRGVATDHPAVVKQSATDSKHRDWDPWPPIATASRRSVAGVPGQQRRHLREG